MGSVACTGADSELPSTQASGGGICTPLYFKVDSSIIKYNKWSVTCYDSTGAVITWRVGAIYIAIGGAASALTSIMTILFWNKYLCFKIKQSFRIKYYY